MIPGGIYYRSFKPIAPGTELLVWYGDEYARELGVIRDKNLLLRPHYVKGTGKSVFAHFIFAHFAHFHSLNYRNTFLSLCQFLYVRLKSRYMYYVITRGGQAAGTVSSL